MLDKILDGSKKLADKSKDVVEGIRLKTAVEKTEQEISLQKIMAGNIALQLYSEGKIEDTALGEVIAEVQKMQQHREELQERLKELQRKGADEAQLFGTETVQSKFCSACGRENAGPAQFCTGCGAVLPTQLPHGATGSAAGSHTVITGFWPMVVCSVAALMLYWFPWVTINIWPVLRSFSGADLAREVSGSMYFLIPVYCLAVLIGIGLQIKGVITAKHLKIMVYGGFLALLIIPVESYFQAVQTVKQAEKVFGPGMMQGMNKGMGQEFKDMITHTIWYYAEIAALLGIVVSMALYKPKTVKG